MRMGHITRRRVRHHPPLVITPQCMKLTEIGLRNRVLQTKPIKEMEREAVFSVYILYSIFVTWMCIWALVNPLLAHESRFYYW
jgi:hypothetical protein